MLVRQCHLTGKSGILRWASGLLPGSGKTFTGINLRWLSKDISFPKQGRSRRIVWDVENGGAEWWSWCRKKEKLEQLHRFINERTKLESLINVSGKTQLRDPTNFIKVEINNGPAVVGFSRYVVLTTAQDGRWLESLWVRKYQQCGIWTGKRKVKIEWTQSTRYHFSIKWHWRSNVYRHKHFRARAVERNLLNKVS